MQYISTRGLESSFSFSDILFEGYAEDGGLYVPAVFPKVDAHTLMTWRGLSYASLAFEVIRLFAEELPKEDLWQICSEAYQAGNFGHTRGMFTAEEITPVKWLHDQVGLLELSNGPTLAFDDIALQFMSRLFDTSFAQGRPRTLLGATTGDMGAAAEAAFGGHKNIKVVMLSPKDRMSQFQAAQLYSNQDPNVVNIEVNGTFDECQDIVRTILEDREYAKAHGLGAINSVLWARIVPQIVYYFYAYFRLAEQGAVEWGKPVDFCVPTGNFGDILAGYYAKQMGLPVGRLVCASNKNNVLTDFLRTGTYDARRTFYKTTSPSMDILISSNLERLLYHVSGSSEKVAGWMQELSATGKYTVDAETLAKIQQSFAAGYADDADGAAEIKARFDGDHYLCDTHTAVAFRVAETRRTDAPMVVLSTASPFKFPRDVLTALGVEAPASDFAAMAALTAGTGAEAPASLRELDKLEVRFKTVLQPADIRTAALR